MFMVFVTLVSLGTFAFVTLVLLREMELAVGIIMFKGDIGSDIGDAVDKWSSSKVDMGDDVGDDIDTNNKFNVVSLLCCLYTLVHLL